MSSKTDLAEWNGKRFRVCAPLGMTTTDKRGHETDHAPGAILTFAQLHTLPRYVRLLIRAGDLEEVTDDANVPAR